LKIAIAGKGGSGKSFISAGLARLFAVNSPEYYTNVYAVDADPGGGLGAAMGLSKNALESVKPIVDMRDFIKADDEDGALYLSSPDAYRDDERYHITKDGVRFLRMTDVKQAGSGCYCHEYNFLQALLNSIMLAEKDVLIVDMGAGVEHLARGTIKGADLLLVVTEPTRVCIETSKTVKSLGAGLGIGAVFFVANKIRSEKEELFIRASFRRGELIGLVRMSEELAEYAIGVGVGRGQPKPEPRPNPDVAALYHNITSILGI